MVEFAIILPVLVMLVFGIIQFSIAFNRVQGLHAAAREGARTASIPTSSLQDIRDRVNEALVGINYDAPPTIPPPAEGSCAGRQGGRVTVVVTAPYTVSIPLIPAVNLNLTGQGVFRCE